MANQERSAVFFSKLYSDFMEDIYSNFLSLSELDDLKKGLEIYLSADEIQERLDRRAELMAAEAREDCDCEECSLDEEIVSSVVESMEELKEHGLATEDEVKEVKALKKKPSPKKQK